MFAVVPRFIAPIARRTFATSSRALISRPSLAASSSFASKWQQQRAYSAEAGLTHDIIQQRILEVLTSFEKVDPAKVRTRSLPVGTRPVQSNTRADRVPSSARRSPPPLPSPPTSDSTPWTP